MRLFEVECNHVMCVLDKKRLSWEEDVISTTIERHTMACNMTYESAGKQSRE